MKAHLFKREDYSSDVTVLDINVISEDECKLLGYDPNERFFLAERGVFYVKAVLTFSELDLPVGSDVWFLNPDHPSRWNIFARNKGYYLCPFRVDKYTEDEAKIKTMLREWAENVGIEFG